MTYIPKFLFRGDDKIGAADLVDECSNTSSALSVEVHSVASWAVSSGPKVWSVDTPSDIFILCVLLNDSTLKYIIILERRYYIQRSVQKGYLFISQNYDQFQDIYNTT